MKANVHLKYRRKRGGAFDLIINRNEAKEPPVLYVIG